MFGQGFNSPQLHQRFERRLKANQKTGSTAQVPLPFSLARPLPRSPLRSADGHRNRDAIVPRYLHISAFPIGNRYSVADSVRSLQLPSAPPALRADARAARYESISPYPIGARYSVLASLVLTAQSDPKTGSTAQVPLPFSLARPLPRSPLRSADGHRNRDAIVPRYLHISAFPIGNRYSVADSVRSLQLPSAPPTLRADARAARYESISPGTMTDTQLQ